MPIISPSCLENLIDLGRWLGVTEVNMDRAIHEPALTPELERIGGASFHMVAGYNITEIEGARKRIVQNCPQGEQAGKVDTPQQRFQLTLDSVKEQWAASHEIVAHIQLKSLQATLLDWVDDIVFHSEEPSRHARVPA